MSIQKLKGGNAPHFDEYNCCFQEIKRNSMYIMRTKSHDGSFIQHDRALAKMDILLVDQGVDAKLTRAKNTTAEKRTGQDNEAE